MLYEYIYGPNAVFLPYFDYMAPSEHCSHVKMQLLLELSSRHGWKTMLNMVVASLPLA